MRWLSTLHVKIHDALVNLLLEKQQSLSFKLSWQRPAAEDISKVPNLWWYALVILRLLHSPRRYRGIIIIRQRPCLANAAMARSLFGSWKHLRRRDASEAQAWRTHWLCVLVVFV